MPQFDVCVVGAGIVGMTTAERLCREGMKVCVIDRHEYVAAETSFVSSGQLEPVRVDHLVEYSDPTALGVKGIATIVLGFPRWTLNYLNYERKMRMNPGLSEQMTLDIHKLGSDGMDAAKYWSKKFPSVFRFGRSSITGKCNFPMDPADPTYLSAKDPVNGAPLVTFRSHEIATGSPYDMCKELESLCKKRGAVFKYGTKFTGVEKKDDGTVTALNTTKGNIEASKYVFCTGISTDRFFPMLPMWGIIREYAFNSKNKGLFGSQDIIMSTLPKPKPGAQSYVVVVENKDTGKRTLRLGGGAEVSATKPGLEAFDAILERVKGHGEKPIRDWIGCRAVSPDGAPIIGKMPGYSNLYVNCGQSFWGWTLSFGSAEALSAHLVHNKPLPASFNPDRFLFSSGDSNGELQRTVKD